MFSSLKILLTVVADAVLSKAGKVILKSLGLGLMSGAVVFTLFQQLISYAQNQWGQLSADVLQILALGNVDYGLSLVIMGCTIKVTLMMNKISLGKAN